MLVLFSTPADNDRSPRYMEKALAAIHQGLRPGQCLQLEYGIWDDHIALGCRFPTAYRDLVLGPLIANYPRCSLEVVAPGEDEPPEWSRAWHVDIVLAPDLFPMLRHSQFEDLLGQRFADPIDSLLRALRPADGITCRLELTLRRATFRATERALSAVQLLDRAFFQRHRWWAAWFARRLARRRWRPLVILLSMLAFRSQPADRAAPLDVTGSYRHEREADLQAAADKLGGHLFSARLRLIAYGAAHDAHLAAEKLQALVGALGPFTRSRLATFQASRVTPGRGRGLGQWFLLGHEELATLWHPPTAGVNAERLQVATFAELEPPSTLPSGAEPGSVPFGRVRYRDHDRLCGLAREDRRRHVHVIGRTGVGKSTFLLNQLVADIEHGAGVALIDPHGDLAEQVLRCVPRGRTGDVIYFDTADPNYAVGFNPLACPDPARSDQVTSGVVGALKKVFDSWGPRLENTLRNAVQAAVEQRGTFLSLWRFLTDDAYREVVVPTIGDDLVRAFWQTEFAGWSRAYRTEAVSAVTNKIQPFLTSRSVRAILGQADRTLDLRWVLDHGKILIVNLSKGRLGEDNAMLLGSLLVASVQQAALSRADLPEEQRRDFYLYIDEFQNFVTSAFETILSEARKYRLNLTVSHQFLAQLPPATASAVAGNVGSLVAFAVGSEDAAWLAPILSTSPDQIRPHDLTSLPKYTAYARLLVDGLTQPPFSLTTLAPPVWTEDRTAAVVATSRRQFARPTADILRQLTETHFGGKTDYSLARTRRQAHPPQA